jgi:hypothetical protein
MTKLIYFSVLKEPSEIADLSPPAQFRTLSDNEEGLDEDDDDDDEDYYVRDKKPFCR